MTGKRSPLSSTPTSPFTNSEALADFYLEKVDVVHLALKEKVVDALQLRPCEQEKGRGFCTKSPARPQSEALRRPRHLPPWTASSSPVWGRLCVLGFCLTLPKKGNCNRS